MSKFETSEASSLSINIVAGVIAGLGLAASLVADQAAEPKVMEIDQSTVIQYKYNDHSLNTGGTPLYSDTMLYNSW